MPVKSPHLADIPKLFFLDASRSSVSQARPFYEKCETSRGYVQDAGVPKMQYLKPNAHVTRGGRTPSVGNYLLAYSTMPTMKAFEQPMEGGFWMQHLARELQEEKNRDSSLTDVLTEVNDRVLEEMDCHCYQYIQQPVLESTLRKRIYLLREARLMGKIDACLLM